MSDSHVSITTYAFSFDRESFRGAFATREQALDAGLRDAADRASPVEAVYVGKRVPTDPQADHHAEGVVRSMRQRMQAGTGDTGYLRRANEHVMADLDAGLEAAIVAWLTRHDLTPAARVTGISEHPRPSVAAHGPSRSDEVGPMGGEE